MRPLVLVLLLTFVGCSGARASVEVEQDRVSFVDAASRKVAIELDLLAHDQLGGGIGWYCIRTTFPQDPAPQTTCANDLSDGDRKTVRIVSTADQNNGAAIAVDIRNNDVDVGRNLVGPVR